MRNLVVFVAALIAFAMPASAQSGDWAHSKSGFSVPAEIGVMRRGQIRDLSDGKAWDVMVQYGQDDEPVTVYVYRSAYPNPVLWFERTRRAMEVNVGAPFAGFTPRSFTLAGASAPNGLREELDLPAGGRWKSTAVAIAQIGEWIVKARITSQSLDRSGVTAKMDQLLGAFRFARATPKPFPLLAPAPCTDNGKFPGEKKKSVNEAVKAAAAVTGVLIMAEARGASGLAADPSAWCRTETGLPAEYVTVYRERTSNDWVALIADSGRAIAAHAFLLQAGDGAAAVFASDAASTRVAAIYDAPPTPGDAVMNALPVVTGDSPGLAEIMAE